MSNFAYVFSIGSHTFRTPWNEYFYIISSMKSYTKRQLHKSRGIKTWYLREYEDGKTRYVSLKTSSAKTAQEIVDRMNAARFFPGTVVSELDSLGHGIVTADLEFLKQKEATLGSAGSLQRYQNDIANIEKYCSEHRIDNLEDWNSRKAQEFTNDLSRDFGPVKTLRLVAMASQIFKWAMHNYDLNLKNPFQGVEKPKKPKRAPEFWTPEEIDILLDHAPTKEMRLCWAFMAFAGLRRSEAISMRPSSIQNGKLRVIGKGNKEDFVPIADRLQSEIDLAGGIYTNSYAFRYVCEALKKVAKQVHVSGKKSNPHKFRHSFGSNLLRAGVGPKQVQNLMRHETIEMTMNVYGHLMHEDLKKAVEVIK